MHDIRAIRADPAGFDAAMARRGLPPVADVLLTQDAGRRAALTAAQDLQARRRARSREIGEGRRAGADTAALEADTAALRDEAEAQEAQAAAFDAEMRAVLERLPSILDADVPDGEDETANVVIRQVGAPPAFDFPARQHFELGASLGLMDFEAAAKLVGSRFVVLKGALARLERALGQFMIDLHTAEHGYQEVSVPLLVNAATAYGTNQLPKFEDDLFKTTDGRYLIPTAEVPLTNLAAGEIIPEASLPWRMAALTDCFRSEAGAAGRDTRGMLRQHQFRKVEMVSITHPDASAPEQERMTRCAELVLERLELPYRRVLLAAGDTGPSSARTFDLEVWLPGQGAWREISSCSNCRDFQARRMNARFRATEGRPNEGRGVEGRGEGRAVGFVHTLNGSGVAVGRALIAVMENGQRADGSVVVPAVLRPYMAGLDRIGPA